MRYLFALLTCTSLLACTTWRTTVVTCATANQAAVDALVHKLEMADGDWATVGTLAADAGLQIGFCALTQLLSTHNSLAPVAGRLGAPTDALSAFAATLHTLPVSAPQDASGGLERTK